MCVLSLTSVAFAQTAPDTTAAPAPAPPSNPNISVVSKDRSGNADLQIPWFANFANRVAADWNRSFGWTVPKPLTVNLYINGIIMAADAGYFSVSPMTIGQLINIANQPTVGVRDGRPIGPGGGNGGWIEGVNVNYTGRVTQIGTTTPPAETQGHLVHDLALGMMQDVAGAGGPAWFKEGLADLLANGTVPGMNEVNQRAQAWHTANGSGVLATVPTVNADWDNLVGTSGLIRDSSFKVADQAVFFLAQKVGVPALVGILQRTSAGEDFESVLQSVTGYSLSQLDAAYRVTMPLY